MYCDLTNEEREAFVTQNYDCFLPGYTGHCPTLKFHYGQCYGTKTKEILKQMRNNKKSKLEEQKKSCYRENDYKKSVLQPICRNSRSPFEDFALNYKYRTPPYIVGYTGFVPTLNFRYGKSYSKAVGESVHEYTNKQRRVMQAETEVENMLRTKSAPPMNPIRCKDEVDRTLKKYTNNNKFESCKISPEYPPIAGYTGHIPRVKGNERSLSQSYHTVVKRGFTHLQEEKERAYEMRKVQNQIGGILEEFKRT